MQDAFIGNLRAARNIANGTAPISRTARAASVAVNVPRNIDQPASPSIEDRRRMINNAWNGAISLDGASSDFDSARQGSRFSYRDRLRGRVTPLQYESFVNNIGNFQNMMDEWAVEDDPQKRADVIKKYSAQYDFNNNVVFEDLLKSLAPYDSMDYNASLNGGERFTRDRRNQWVDAFRENMETAKQRYYPYMRA